MNKEQMLLDALNRFGNFTSATQEFSEEQLGVIYELMDMVEQRNKVSGADTRTEPALPIQSVMASVSDELLLRAGKYEDEANADFDTNGVQHNLNIGRYDGLMQAVEEINKHLP